MAARSGTRPLRRARSEDAICSKCLSKSVQDVRQGVRRVAEGSRSVRPEYIVKILCWQFPDD